MYTQDGKPVTPPMGRRNPEVSRLEFDKLLQKVEALEAIVANIKPEEKSDAPDDIEALKAEAIALGIEIKGTWGAARIKRAIDKRKAE